MRTLKKEHPLYNIWMGMKGRCNNPNHVAWEWYGGKGIKVCERWLKFENFVEDMGERPPHKTIDRIDGSKDYSPENCRWATYKEQGRNKADIIYLTIDGVEYMAVELSDISGHKTDTIVERARQGLTYEEVISKERRSVPSQWAGWLRENARRAEERFCHMGHEFTPANTIRQGPEGRNRRCRECHRLTVLRYKDRKRRGL